MSAPAVLTLPFEGEALTTLTWTDRPAWIAREIGRRIGYADGGKRLVTRIRREWADEFIEGTDYVVLAGEELAGLKHVLGPDSAAVASRTSGLMLLLEPGLHLVLTKTDKPIGKRLRRFLVDEVLPQLARGAVVRAAMRDAHMVSPDAVRWFRELRLARRVSLDDRRFQADALRRCITVLRVMGHLDDAAYVQWEVRVAELALGRRLEILRNGPLGGSALGTTRTLASLADDLGESVDQVVQAATQLGLAADGEFGRTEAMAIEASLRSQGLVAHAAA